MGSTCDVETAILQHVNVHGSATVDELFRALSRFTLNQVFFGIDRLSRQCKVSLRHPTRLTYLVSAADPGTPHQKISRSVGSALNARG